MFDVAKQIGKVNVNTALGEVFRWFSNDKNLCVTPDAKEFAAALLSRGVHVQCAFADPRIAQWLLDPDDKRQMTIAELAGPFGVVLTPCANTPSIMISRGVGAVACTPALTVRIGAVWPEAFIAVPLTAVLLHRLEVQGLLQSFWDVEMPIAVLLAWMEYFGIALDPRDPHHTYSHALYKLAALEQRVREIVGRRVLLSSAEDVGRALFEDLGLPLPPGVRFRRKNNGRIAYRSSAEILKKLSSHPVVEHIIEHRRLAHAARRFESLAQAGEVPHPDPLCAACVATGAVIEAQHQSGCRLFQRVRTDLAQTATATGRLATCPGSQPLLQLENAFEVSQVWRPSLHDELIVGKVAEVGARVFMTVASEAPPRARQLREGVLACAVGSESCNDVFMPGDQPLSAYWVACGWSAYASPAYASSVRQVRVRLGTSVLSYPADQVWRLAAPVSVSAETPPLVMNPRSLLVADAGYVLLSVDYSQLEVRLMAHFSQDDRFVQILHSDGDVFRHIASGWLRKSEEDVTAEERSGAKRICYGLVYGIGAAKLADELGISRTQAKEFQASFSREFPGIEKWIQACCEQARQCGYVETLQGRRRFLPMLAASAVTARSHAERQAVNTCCQASAADLVKIAMLSIHERLRRLHVHDAPGKCRMAARMLLQIHDELLLEVDMARLDEVRQLVTSEMVAVGQGLLVPLKVKWRTGPSWGSLC